MICVISLIAFGILAIFSAKYRKWFKFSIECIKTRLKGERCPKQDIIAIEFFSNKVIIFTTIMIFIIIAILIYLIFKNINCFSCILSKGTCN